mgnify:CR=1 FL=1
MAVLIGSARIDENGNATGGKAGKQKPIEVSTQNWYPRTDGKTLVVIRHKNPEVREKMAQAMEWACASNHIGYDQNQRLTLYNELKDKEFDIRKLTKDVETDCSALVRVCLAYAGVMVGNFTTYNEKQILSATKEFDIYTSDDYGKSSAKLVRGDILVTSSKGHTVIVLSDGSNAGAPHKEYTYGERNLQKGMIGKDVQQLQINLIAAGYSVGSCGTDGDFGAATDTAVRQFQKDSGLTVDGIAGPKTLSKLSGYRKSTNTMVTTGYVYLRQGPATSFNAQGVLNPGQEVEVISESNGFAQLSGGGYVSLKYLKSKI